ncbi:hypothetical protein [Actinophytocola gossypii]|uniref:Uncharacterized protein n=1 Tax=Actinophytocola gossypii TaxID=2812003 RepID=A0ABT2J873_9PSEU|nr:hypothetical protein [Actinophytocola gossypii]MCT2583968.1 hypothetical protein [Actinophytocola gossypii]
MGSVPAASSASDDQPHGLAPLAGLQSRSDAPEPTATEPGGDPQVPAISESDLSPAALHGPPTDLRPPPTLGPPPDVPDPTSGDHSIDSSSSGDSDEVRPTVEDEPSHGPPRPTHAFSLPPLADELPPFQLPPRATLDSAAGPFRRSPLPPEPESLELSPPPPEPPPVRALHPVTNGLRAVPPLDEPAAVWQAPPADPVSPATNGSPRPRPRHASPAETTRTVLVGLPVGDYLSLWVNDELTYWRLADPDAVRARLGAGIEARSEVEDRRFRETALLDPDANTLFLADRFRDSTGRLGGPTTALEPATEDEARRAADDKAISALYHWLGEVALAAGERDELVAVEVGGWTATASPRVEVTLRTDGEEWHSVVEASPVPVDAPVWRDQQPVDGDTQLLVSPATDRTIRAAGLLTRFAVGTWSLHPFQLGLTFGPNPTLSETPTR